MPTSAHAERLRLAALRAYRALDRAPIPELDGLVALAAHVTGAPLAVINLLDEERQWQAAAHGGARTEVPRRESMCRFALEEGRTLHTPDAAADERWSDSPFVDGRYGRARMYASAPLIDPDGHVLGTLCVIDPEPRELTTEQIGALGLLADQVVALFQSRRRAQQLADAVDELDRLAHVDGLTGLVNRAAAARALDRMCVTGGWGLLFLDVDDFKAVNDAGGHQAGDAALQEVAARLRTALRPHDLVARWSGDEFVALLADVTTQAEVDEVVARLHVEVARPFRLEDREVPLSVSGGGVVVRPGSVPGQVLREADAAMYEAKRRRRDLQLIR